MTPRRIAALLLFAVAGCDGPAPPASPPATAESSWQEQVASVRTGRHDEIRLSAPVRATQLQDLANGCEGLTALVLDRDQLEDADLAVLPSLPRLRMLKLSSPVGDTGAATIASCGVLENLNLPNATMTDTGLAELTRLPRLELLRLGSPNVTDEGLKELIRLPRLRFLHLIEVPITDAALEHIAAIRTLESFYLDGGHATDDALRKLLAERVDLHFHKDQRHLDSDPNAGHHGE